MFLQKTATLPFLAHMIHLSIDEHFRLRYPVFAQFGRMTAVQTVREKDRQLLEADTGDIWVRGLETENIQRKAC